MQLPREDFEILVSRAIQAQEAAKTPPRLLETRYRAKLDEDALTGTSEWTVMNPSLAAAILPIQSLNLALSHARLGADEAILGELDGKTFGLFVGQPGKHVVRLDWTARGDTTPGGVRFELRIPSCTLTSFELDLPADRFLTISRDTCLISGPQPTEVPQRRLWRITCPSQTQIDLLIRRLPGPEDRPPFILASVRSVQTLAPDVIEAEFDFNVRVVHGTVREFVCQLDPALRPLAITSRYAEIDRWDLQDGASPGSPSQLRIRLREPFGGSPLHLQAHCLAAVGHDGAWICPGLRLRNAVVLGETLVLRVPSDLRLESWRTGNFSLVKATADTGGGQVLTLQSAPGNHEATDERRDRQGPGNSSTVGNPQLPEAKLLRPAARLKLQQPQFHVNQFAWWQIGPESSKLTAQLTYEVLHGQLFRLPVEVPANWMIDRVEVATPGQIRNWTTLPGTTGETLLVVELERAAEAGKSINLVVDLRPAAADFVSRAADKFITFPVVIPKGARTWSGGLAISVDSSYEAVVQTDGPNQPGPQAGPGLADSSFSVQPSAFSSSTTPADRPWGHERPDFYYSFRTQALNGKLKLRPRRARATAQCTNEVVVASKRVGVVTHLKLQPVVGYPSTFDLYVSAPVPGPWNWKCEGNKYSVIAMQALGPADVIPRFLVLGSGNGLSASTLLSLADSSFILRPSSFSSGTLWRLKLDRPLKESITLKAAVDVTGRLSRREIASRMNCFAAGGVLEYMTLTAVGLAVPGTDTEMRWDVPVLAVLGAERQTGEVRLHLAGSGLVRVESEGMREVASEPGAEAPSPWRTFRYAQAPISLVLRGRGIPANPEPQAVADHSQLTSYVESGRVLHHYRFCIHHWNQRVLPIRLPVNTRLLAAKVDGRWIPRALPLQSTADSWVVELPAATGTIHRFEIVYATEDPPWRFWTRLRAPAPVLPVEAMDSRRVWCLPDSISPIEDRKLQRLPSIEGRSDIWGAVRDVVGVAFFAVGIPDEHGNTEQQRILKAVDTRVSSLLREDKASSLGHVLNSLCFEFLRGPAVLVIDGTALEEAGLEPGTPLSRKSTRSVDGKRPVSAEVFLQTLEGVDLLCVTTRSGLLITTRAQFEAWKSVADSNRPLSDSVESAIAEAAVAGYDESGRFWSASDWLRSYEGRSLRENSVATKARGKHDVAIAASFSPHPQFQRQWELLPGVADEESLLVVRRDRLTAIGWALAGLLLLASWRARFYTARRRFALLLTWLGVAGLCTIWLPGALRWLLWWPSLIGALLAAAWYIRPAFKPISSKAPSRIGIFAASVVFVALGRALLGQVATSEPQTVLLVPGPEGSPEKLTALIPPELLERLQRLAQRGARDLQDIILLQARYEGRLNNGAAEFQAEFAAYSFVDGTSVLTLPLDGIELQEALLDGRPAYPVAALPAQSGLSMKVIGRGHHKVQLRFSVRLSVDSDNRDLHFAIPEVAQSQLILTVPDGAKYLHNVFGRGAQRLTHDGKGITLRADLGRVNAVQVQWRQEGPGSTSAVAEVRELYLWDLQASASNVAGLLQYRVRRGALPSLVIALPENMEVAGLEASALPGSRQPAPRVKQWNLSGSGKSRQLWIEFQVPVTVGAQILLELVSTDPVGATAILSLPTPKAVTGSEGFLAYRVAERKSSLVEYRRVTGLEPAIFADLWQSALAEDPGPLENAYTFRRVGDASPFLRLNLDPPTGRVACSQEVRWSIGQHGAEVRATAKLTAAQGEMSVLAWDVPAGVDITDIIGPQVRTWSRVGSQVQIWLKHSVRETALNLTGWLARQGAVSAPLALPCLRFPEAEPHSTYLRVSADMGLTLRSDGLHNLLPLPESSESPGATDFLIKGGPYAASFYVDQAPAKADARAEQLGHIGGAMSKVENEASGARLQAPSALGEPRPVQIFLDEQAAAIVDGRRWLHRAEYLMYHEAGANLVIMLPQGSRLSRAALDGEPIAPLQIGPQQIWLPLIAGTSLRSLCLFWTFGEGIERLDKPILKKPHLEGGVHVGPAKDETTHWTVLVPPGYLIDGQPEDTAPDGGVARDLRLAHAHLQFSALLGEQVSGKGGENVRRELAKTQQCFYRYLLYAKNRLVALDSLLGTTPKKAALAEKMRELQTANRQLARQYGLEDIRIQAENSSRASLSLGGKGFAREGGPEGNLTEGEELLTGQGTLTYWTGDSRSVVPRLRLVPKYRERTWKALAGSGLLVALLLLAWTLFHFPRLSAWVRAFWPEQMILLGCSIWAMVGLDSTVVLLLLLGVLGRVIFFCRWLLVSSRHTRPIPVTAETAST
jgi:hypothetical protein